MEENIIIFGKNSIIAKNFIKQSKYLQSNIITISRSSNNKNDLVCNFGEFISIKDIESIVSQIKHKLVFKKTIFILFAWCGVPRMIANKDYIWSTNMHIVQNFLNITTYINPSRIIFLSSAGALYPENVKSYKFSEKDIPLPYTDYGRQKLISENLLSYYAKKNNQDLTILRISSGYGFDSRFSDQGVINKWLYSAINEKTLHLYNSMTSQINFISFDQISKAIFISLKAELNGIFNIGTEFSISLKEVIDEITNITKKNIVIEEKNNSERYFNLDTKKFTSTTGTKFELNLRENIRIIYKSIINDN